MQVDIVYIGFVLGHGGDAFQMLDLAAGMAARGKTVRIVVPEIPTTLGLQALAQQKSIDIVRSPLIRADPIAPKQIPEDLVALFETHPASLYHLHTGDFCLSRTVPRVLAELRIPPERVLVTVHSPYDTLTPGDERATAWANAAGARIHTIICPSLHALQTQLKYGVPAANLAHIPNGVHTAAYRNGNGARIRTELHLQPETPLLVCTSRLDPQKRPGDALEAFITISQEFPDCHLAYAGSGELMHSLQSRSKQAGLADRVHFAGQRHDIPDWLNSATVWLMPTERENFSLALLEALAAGCPILTTLCKGNDEVLKPGINCETHEVGDVAEIARKLRMLLSTPGHREILSINSIQTSHSYDVAMMVSRYAELYSGMVGE